MILRDDTVTRHLKTAVQLSGEVMRWGLCAILGWSSVASAEDPRVCAEFAGRTQGGCIGAARERLPHSSKAQHSEWLFALAACELNSALVFQLCIADRLSLPSKSSACESAKGYFDAMSDLRQFASLERPMSVRTEALAARGGDAKLLVSRANELMKSMKPIKEIKRQELLDGIVSTAKRSFIQIGTAGDRTECDF